MNKFIKLISPKIWFISACKNGAQRTKNNLFKNPELSSGHFIILTFIDLFLSVFEVL